MHNAIVHNLPEGGSVRVTTHADSGYAVLTVENTGEKLPPHVIPTLTEPFQRGRGRTRGDHAGLGLAIVDRIARVHDGSLAIAPRPAGGLEVVVRLPAPRTAPQAIPAIPAARRVKPG